MSLLSTSKTSFHHRLGSDRLEKILIFHSKRFFWLNLPSRREDCNFILSWHFPEALGTFSQYFLLSHKLKILLYHVIDSEFWGKATSVESGEFSNGNCSELWWCQIYGKIFFSLSFELSWRCGAIIIIIMIMRVCDIIWLKRSEKR